MENSMNNSDKKCFVLMPFIEELKEIYLEIYKPICTELGFYCWRVDEISRPGSITKDIVQGIVDSDIVIADLTWNNPNVFYELGIAHTLNKKTIMTCQKNEVIPFDVSNYRVIIYQHTLLGSKELAENLKKSISEILETEDAYSNPVSDILSIPNSVGVPNRPLSETLDFSRITQAVRRYLYEKNIINPADVSKIDFDAMLKTKNIGKLGVHSLLKQLIENNLVKENPYFSKFLKY